MISCPVMCRARSDARKTTAITMALDTLMTEGVLTKGGMNSIVGGSKNNISLQMMVGMTMQEQLLSLNLAVKYLAEEVRPSTRAVSDF